MYTSRDTKCHFQGHVTLMYKVTRQGHDIGLYSIDFPEWKNLKNKKKIIALACIQAKTRMLSKVTWRHDVKWQRHDVASWQSNLQ